MPLTTLLRRRPVTESTGISSDLPAEGGDLSAIGDLRWRDTVRFVGRVRSVRVQPRANVPTLECTLVDESGGITVVFLGRRSVPGLRLGTQMMVEGRAGSHHGKLAVLNPEYTLIEP